jgi:hypothetical protein
MEVEKALVKAAGVMRNIGKNLFARPEGMPGGSANELVNQMVTAFLDRPEAALHVIGEHMPAARRPTSTASTCSILSMMLAKETGLCTRRQSQILGVGALAARRRPRRHPRAGGPPAPRAEHAPERNLRELHCEYGVRLGKQIGLPDAVLRIVAQHHELADGSGYPNTHQGRPDRPAGPHRRPGQLLRQPVQSRSTWPRP